MKIANDGGAYFNLGIMYLNGHEEVNVAPDIEKGLQLLSRGGELGSTQSYL
jgi:TPR repeat protein